MKSRTAILGAVLVLAHPGFGKSSRIEDTQILAAIFISVLAIVGGLMEMAAWLNWTLLPHG